MEGSSLVTNRKRNVAYALVTVSKVTEAGTLLMGISAQEAELIALMRALWLSQVHRALGINWESHSAWRPQSSGPMERKKSNPKNSSYQTVSGNSTEMDLGLWPCTAPGKSDPQKWDQVKSLRNYIGETLGC